MKRSNQLNDRRRAARLRRRQHQHMRARREWEGAARHPPTYRAWARLAEKFRRPPKSDMADALGYLFGSREVWTHYLRRVAIWP